MATYYGNWKTESTTGAKARLYLVTSVAQNQALNYSTITVKTYIQVANNRPSQEGSFMGATTNTNINSIHAYGSTSDSFGMNSSKLLSTKSVDIVHNDDGTRGCYLQASGTINVVNDYGNYETMTLSLAGRTETLPTINRTSSISNNSGSGVDFGTTITFSITRPSTETHTLSYVVNGTTYTIGTGIGTSCTYTFPTSLINSFPSNASPSIWVSCVSSNGTSCGTTVYLKVPSNYVPSCSLAISDAGDVPSSWGIWLKSKSKISGTVTAEGIAGSWISSYYCSANGSSYSSSSFTTDYLKNSGGQTITASVSDSRGRVKSVNQILVVTDYWTPTLSSFSVVRCNADGVEENEGTYGKVKCNFSIAPCNDNNTKSLVVKYGDVSKTFNLNSYSGSVEASSTELFSGLSTASNHAFEFYLIDYFNPNGIKFSFTMTPAFTTISYLNGGKGISIGQVATEEGFNCYMDANFAGALMKNNNPVPAVLNSNSSSSEDTYSCNYINNIENIKGIGFVRFYKTSDQSIPASVVTELILQGCSPSNEYCSLNNGKIHVSKKVKGFILNIYSNITQPCNYYITFNGTASPISGPANFPRSIIRSNGAAQDVTISVYNTTAFSYSSDNYWNYIDVLYFY